MRLVVIGGVAAGTKAASRARRTDPNLEITIYQEEPEISQSECGLPYLLSGVVDNRDALIARTPEEFAEKDVEVLTRHRVENIDSDQKKLDVKNLTTGEEFEDSYDRLIMATGAKAALPPLAEGADLGGVFTLRFLTDSDKILSFIEERSPKKAIVIGGNYIGLEVAENLSEFGMDISLLEAEDQVVPPYDPEVAERIEEHLEEKGVAVFTGTPVEALLGDEEGRVRAVRFGEDEEMEAEIVVLAAGIRPEVPEVSLAEMTPEVPEISIAEAAGAEIGPTGAICVDKHLKTNLKDVWAAGDCVESVNLVTGDAGWVPLGDTANQMGRVAGTNAALGEASEDLLEFAGVLGTGIFKVFELGVAQTGLSEKEAKEAGFEVVTASVESVSKAGYYPGGQSTFIKLTADGATGRLIGAQVVGGNADKYVDICATAIWGKLAYPDLVNVDLAYAPPFGPTLSPVIAAASVLAGEFEKKTEGVQARE